VTLFPYTTLFRSACSNLRMPLPIARASVVAVTAASRSWFCLDDAIAFSCVQPHITGRGKPYSAPYFGRHSTASRSILPRSYIWRFTGSSRVIWPSIWPFDHGKALAATACNGPEIAVDGKMAVD
jgi:hypothetical protein